MESPQVSFKVAHHDVIRLLVFPSTPAPCWAQVLEILKARFDLSGSDIVLQYNDSDGDLISLSTDAELRENWPPAQKMFYVHAPDDIPALVSDNGPIEYLTPETADERAALLDCLRRTVVDDDVEISHDFWSVVLELIGFRVDEETLAALGWHKSLGKADAATTEAEVDPFEDDVRREEIWQQTQKINKEIRERYGKQNHGPVRFDDRLRGPPCAKLRRPQPIPCYECGGRHFLGHTCPMLIGAQYGGPLPVPARDCFVCGDKHPVNVECPVSQEEIQRSVQRSRRGAGIPDSLCMICREHHRGLDCPLMKCCEEYSAKNPHAIPGIAFGENNFSFKNGPRNSRPYKPVPHYNPPPFPHRGVVDREFVDSPLPYSSLPASYHPNRKIYPGSPHPRW